MTGRAKDFLSHLYSVCERTVYTHAFVVVSESSAHMDSVSEGCTKNVSTCRSIVFGLGQMASLEDNHSQSVGGGLVTQREQ